MSEPVFDKNGWCHDMAAAPRDGQSLLLWCQFADSLEMVIAAWSSNPKHAKFPWRKEGIDALADWLPTAWRPLPEPPEPRE